jgi:hypothetical protein
VVGARGVLLLRDARGADDAAVAWWPGTQDDVRRVTGPQATRPLLSP